MKNHGETPVTFNEPKILIYKYATEELYNKFINLADNYISSANNMLTLKSSLCGILNSLVYSDSNPSGLLNADNPIYPAVRYIENNLNKQISVSELAGICALSESTLRRNFKTFVGMSPIDYINKLKINKAKQLLEFPEVTIASICEQLSFYDASYFYRLFKRHSGMTPVRYRKIKNRTFRTFDS